ncbi:MAG: LPS assembly lipoprotein LptE [Nitrospirota bacterium]
MRPLILFLLMLAGCGYTLGERPSPAAGGAPTLAVELFENATAEPLLGELLSRRLKSQLAAAGPWRIVNPDDQPTWLLRGRVTGLRTTPMAFDADSRATEYRTELRVSLTLTRTADGATPWSASEVTGAADYYASRDAIATRQSKERSFQDAGQRVADQVAQQLSLSAAELSSASDASPAARP